MTFTATVKITRTYAEDASPSVMEIRTYEVEAATPIQAEALLRRTLRHEPASTVIIAIQSKG